MWPNGRLNQSSAGRTSGTSIVINMSQIPWLSHDERNSWWNVVVVCAANGRWVSSEPSPRVIYFEPRAPVDSNPDNNCR